MKLGSMYIEFQNGITGGDVAPSGLDVIWGGQPGAHAPGYYTPALRAFFRDLDMSLSFIDSLEFDPRIGLLTLDFGLWILVSR
jgi:hypothetical protein